jgi:hypothetical protein
MSAIRDACIPRPEVLQGDLQDAIFAADFGLVIEGRAAEVYQDAAKFFQNTHPTANLIRLSRTIFERLANKQEAGAAVRLSTGFGGGKTHSLIALWHLAQHIANPSIGSDVLPVAGRPQDVVVIGIDGSKFATSSIWAELALKLGGEAAYAKVQDDRISVPPAIMVKSWLPPKPLLILMDELVIPLSTLNEQQRAAFIAFLNMLIAEITARPQAVLVITDTAGQAAYAQQAGELDKLNLDSATRRMGEMLGRKMSDWDPVGNEAAQVINRRLFERIDSVAAQSASGEYFNAYKRIVADYPDALPTQVATTDYAQRIVQSYPFHPRLLETAQDRLGALQDFNKSRGTLRLFARLLRDIWENDADLTMINAGDINWQSQRIQADLLDRLNRDPFKAAVNADVVKHASELDADFSTDVHRRVASALLLESLPLNANAAMDQRDLGLAVLRPSDVGHEAGEAIDRLMAVCWHTYRTDGGQRYQFRYEPNVLKLIDERSRRPDFLETARQGILSFIQGYFGGHTFSLSPWPTTPRSVADSAQLKLVLCDEETLAQKICDYIDTSEEDAPQPRRFRNAIVAIAANSEGFQRAVERKRYELAAEEILKETTGRDKASLRQEIEQVLAAVRKNSRIDAIRAFNRVIFQGRPSVTLEEKYLANMESPLESTGGQAKLKDFLDDNKFIYPPNAALDVDLFLDRILVGSTPSVDHPGSYPASAVVERALSYASLRLMQNDTPVRNAAIKAVSDGKLLVRLPNGDVYDSDGLVSGPAGQRRRSQSAKLTTLKMTIDVLLAPVDADCAQEWVRVDPEPTDQSRVTVEDAAIDKFVAVEQLQSAIKNGELDVTYEAGVAYIVCNDRYENWSPQETQAEDERAASDWDKAISLAGKRRLRRLTFNATSPDAAKTLMALAVPLGASSLEATALVSGKVKDGGVVNFSVNGVKATHSLKPLETAATLWRNLVEDASFSADLILGFGDDGIADAASKLENAKTGAQTKSGTVIGLSAEFGDPL